MLIISENEDVIVNVDNCTNIYIRKENGRILCEKTVNSPHCELGRYDTKEKARRAFGILVNAMMEGKQVFRLPGNNDERLNTSLRNNGGFRTLQTNGKTK